jgi:hypothetical protein
MATSSPHTNQASNISGELTEVGLGVPSAFLEPLSPEDRSALTDLDAREAVDALAARYRVEPTRERAVVLRDLRILAGQLGRAAANGQRTIGPALSDDHVDLEYTVEGLPVVTPGSLTHAALSAALRERGCLLVRGCITRDQAAERRAAIDHAIMLADTADRPRNEWLSPAPRIAGQAVSPVSRMWTRREGGTLTVDSPRILEDVLDDYRSAGIVAAAESFVRERPALAAEKCYLRRFPGEGLMDNRWHQDGAFIGTARVLNGWMTYSDCGRFAPGMELLLRRVETIHTIDEESDFDWSLSDRQVRAMADVPSELVVPEFEAGDCLLFDHFFVHRTFRGPDSRDARHSAETWFFASTTMKEGYVPVLV